MFPVKGLTRYKVTMIYLWNNMMKIIKKVLGTVILFPLFLFNVIYVIAWVIDDYVEDIKSIY